MSVPQIALHPRPVTGPRHEWSRSCRDCGTGALTARRRRKPTRERFAIGRRNRALPKSFWLIRDLCL